MALYLVCLLMDRCTVSLYIKYDKVSVTYVRSSVTVGMTSSVANNVTMTIAGLWRYGDWQHVATGCTAVVYCE